MKVMPLHAGSGSMFMSDVCSASCRYYACRTVVSGPRKIIFIPTIIDLQNTREEDMEMSFINTDEDDGSDARYFWAQSFLKLT